MRNQEPHTAGTMALSAVAALGGFVVAVITILNLLFTVRRDVGR